MDRTRAHLDISWQQCHGASCDLCDDASEPHAVQAVQARPAAERAPAARPARARSITVEDCDAVFGAELLVY